MLLFRIISDIKSKMEDVNMLIDQILGGGLGGFEIGGIVGEIMAWWKPIWHKIIALFKGTTTE